ncbi:hypothetical protein KBY31_02470 [Ruegeria pomeroyi]|uniref:hypothetical protein n=1 Tax=Ruegeria pomeroyi TaxID=89184 RepID=UPI001F2D93F1|nr:hypothetical protein [Ruegeria pomeroyi]MCE8509726.1 hypothetical protein [Ruegeria pomeroyi]MCE8515561.1 hypothetical protein [Ruegeria pomeroyi]
MRRAVFAICLAYALLYGGAWISTVNASLDAAGRGMALGFLTVGMGTTAIFAIPALILAISNRALNWALGLSLVPAVLLLVVMAMGVV